MDAGQVTAGNLQVAGGGRPDGDDNRIVLLRKPFGGDVLADLDARHEADAFRLQDCAAAIDERLVELEAGNAVTEKSANVGAFLVHCHGPALAPQGDGDGKPGRSRPDDSGGFAVLLFRRAWRHPAVRESRLDDALLALPYHHGLFVEPMHARRLAESGANAGGEFGKIGIGRKKCKRPSPVALRHGAVLVGHEVAERAAVGMAERLTAVHAARGLFLKFRVGKHALDFAPVARALVNRTVDVVCSLHIEQPLAQPVPMAIGDFTSSVLYNFCNSNGIALAMM